MSSKEDYMAKLKAQLAELDTEFMQLEAKIQQAPENAEFKLAKYCLCSV